MSRHGGVLSRWDGGDFQRIGHLPMVARLEARLDGPLHVFPVEGGRTPMAGPFESVPAARLWVVQHLEGLLTPEQLDVWRQAAQLLPPPSDFGHELGLLYLVRKNLTFAQIEKYIPKPERRQADRRALAAGERAVQETLV